MRTKLPKRKGRYAYDSKFLGFSYIMRVPYSYTYHQVLEILLKFHISNYIHGMAIHTFMSSSLISKLNGNHRREP